MSLFAATAPTNQIRYVFLNFRGEDTRNKFVDHLYAALDQARINTFKDDEKLHRGESISELMNAIQESRSAVVVFSKNYAKSYWCLEELAKIIECRDVKGQKVLPVFYDVDPSDVRGQKRSFNEAFEQHEIEFIHNTEKLESWREALVTAPNISGWDVSKTACGREADCIKQIVRHILSYTESHPVEYPIMQDLKTLKVSFHHSTKDEVVTHTIRLPKQSTVGDVINDLKTKVELSNPEAELRLFEVFDYRIYEIFTLNETIESINDQRYTLRAEEVPEEEKNMGPQDHRFDFYFTKDSIQNQQVQKWREPFLLVIREGETLLEVKVRIQKKLQVPDEEFSTWRFISSDGLTYHQGSDILCGHIERKDVYGTEKQSLESQHSHNSPKRPYPANKIIIETDHHRSRPLSDEFSTSSSSSPKHLKTKFPHKSQVPLPSKKCVSTRTKNVEFKGPKVQHAKVTNWKTRSVKIIC